MKMLDEKSVRYTKNLILNGYELKAVNAQNSLVYINACNDIKVVFNNNLRTERAKAILSKLGVQQGKVTESKLKGEVVKLVNLGCISEKTAVSEFGKYISKNKDMGMQA